MRPDSILVIGLKRIQDEDITDTQKIAESDNLKVWRSLRVEVLCLSIYLCYYLTFTISYTLIMHLGYLAQFSFTNAWKWY